MPENYGPWIIGGAVVLLMAKAAIDAVPNPFPAAGRAVKRGAIATIETGDELTGGIQGDVTSSQYWFSADFPFVERDIPLFPGLIKDPDESWPDYLFKFDNPFD
jgi:hypothetical protein